ncbi:MAG: hypothetical protein J6Y20_07275 [Lachnospiraceae bacterium]|nr:hypothetical protein [Lachnospiraceae bacterium]
MKENNEKLEERFRSIALEILGEQAKQVWNEMHVDWYGTTERLLRAYKRMKHRVEYLSEYDLEPKGHSTSFVYSSKPSGIKNFDDIREEAIAERKKSYARTLAQFEEFNSVIEQFKDKPEFKVIRMYYFNEYADGRELPEGEHWTLEQIAFELEKDVRTIYRWRSDIVQQMATIIGGVDAAIAITAFNGAKKKRGEKSE